jgi:hypothetical protein
MTIQELIDNFEQQRLSTKSEVEKLKETLTDREEYLIKLVGGIEALKLYQEQQISETDDTGA